MKKNRWILAFALSLMFLQALPTSGEPPRQPSATPSKISLVEAEIEIYLLPLCRQVRARGVKAGWVQTLSPELNQDDYFFFFVFVVGTEPDEGGSVTLGNFAVNKWTGDIRDVALDEPVVDSELGGVQRILIAGHHINEAALKKYGSSPLWKGKGS